MRSPQSGIFALGTASHAYLEPTFARSRWPGARAAVAALREPRTTMGGVNLVAGFRPELWREVLPDDARPTCTGSTRTYGVDGFTMPATQHDAVLWFSGARTTSIFDKSRARDRRARGARAVADETSSWPYRHDRDLTGFIDGTENPTLIDAPELVLVPEGEAGRGR